MSNVPVIGVALLLWPATAAAQTADTSAGTSDSFAAAVDSGSVAKLESVVITALRMPTELGSATFAAARNAEDVTWRARPGLGLTETLHGIPGVQVDNRYNFSLGERITVRGFGARTQFGVRGVRVLVDGIPATMPDGQTTLNHLDLGAIQSVEVVRTPAAVVHGNAAGGVIAIHTRSPPAEPIAASTRLITGSNGLARRQLSLGGSTAAGSYLLHAGKLDFGGFRAHNSAENRYVTARTVTEIGTTGISVSLHQVRFTALNPGALPDSMVRSAPHEAFPTNVAQNTGQSGKHSAIGFSVTQAFGAAQLATAVYGVRRSFENPILPRIIDLSRRAGGARMSLGSAPEADHRIEWDAGIESATQKDDRLNHTNDGGARGTLTLEQEERVQLRAAFATARAAVGERASLLLGLRHDATKFAVRDKLVTATNPDDSGDRLMRAWSPSAGVSVRFGDHTHIFGTIGSSFETPTTTELANRPDGAGGFNAELRPQRAHSIEMGSNGVIPRGYYQAAVYHSRVRGSLVPFEVPGTPGRQFFRNAASAVHRGIELTLGGSVARGVWARAAYTFTDARYDEYSVDQVSFNGNRIPGVAPHRVETLIRFSRSAAFLDLESRYQSAVEVNDANDARSGAYAIHGMRAGLTRVRWGGFSGAPFAGMDNVFNRRYNSAVTINAGAGRFYEPGAPRNFFVGIDLSVAAARQP